MIKNSCSVRLGSCRMAACPRTVVSRNPVRFVIVRAQDQNSSTPPATPSPTASPSATPAPAAPVREEFLKGQGTAIVTGAISIIVSLAYFALVFVMDQGRGPGGQLIPPPPEAFLP